MVAKDTGGEAASETPTYRVGRKVGLVEGKRVGLRLGAEVGVLCTCGGGRNMQCGQARTGQHSEVRSGNFAGHLLLTASAEWWGLSWAAVWVMS